MFMPLSGIASQYPAGQGYLTTEMVFWLIILPTIAQQVIGTITERDGDAQR
jgi:hypothetical protein